MNTQHNILLVNIAGIYIYSSISLYICTVLFTELRYCRYHELYRYVLGMDILVIQLPDETIQYRLSIFDKNKAQLFTSENDTRFIISYKFRVLRCWQRLTESDIRSYPCSAQNNMVIAG